MLHQSQCLDDSFARPAISIRIHVLSPPGFSHGAKDSFGFETGQLVPTGGNRLTPFCLLTECHTRNILKISFFLNSTGIGQNDFGRLLKPNHVQKRNRFNQSQPRFFMFFSLPSVQNIQLLARAWMDWKNEGILFGNTSKCRNDILQPLGVVRVFSAMDRRQVEMPLFEIQSLSCMDRSAVRCG